MSPFSPPLHLIFLLSLCLFLFTLLRPSTQMLQRSLKQWRPPRQMQQRRAPSPRMTKAKSNLKKAELRVWRITQKQKSKKVALCLSNVKAVRFYLFVIFCVAMIFSCWGSFQRYVFWLKLILWGSGVDDNYKIVIMKNDCYLDDNDDEEEDLNFTIYYKWISGEMNAPNWIFPHVKCIVNARYFICITMHFL